ncbi:MerR family transcriptional regulator [Actinospica durhamensis]|uniref:MerR family transcriptional regulator n=1 Tax=Actinospica durhamensis TaxID=1508375 RepID=A0A941ESD9_9ACTN|nr:MerR family transcriptional regulator [Actinospica durhamensis]MBR7836650.1 MerR family transcriptional regulator [Actinospica durhamensis]
MTMTQQQQHEHADVERLSIGQVAERTGLSVHTLRFYEAEGLMVDPVERLAGGRRSYRADDVEWLTICTNLRSSGMPLPEIRRYAELVREGAGNEEDRLDLLRRHREEVLDRIAKLHGWLEVISHKVAVYEERLDHGATGRLWVQECALLDRAIEPAD